MQIIWGAGTRYQGVGIGVHASHTALPPAEPASAARKRPHTAYMFLPSRAACRIAAPIQTTMAGVHMRPNHHPNARSCLYTIQESSGAFDESQLTRVG